MFNPHFLIKLTNKLSNYLFASKPKKILFNHLPKCGGSSLNTYLGTQYPENKIFAIEGSDPRKSVDLFKTLSQEERYSYDLITGHNANELLDYVHPDCLKITVFRDPIHRIVSHYYYAKDTKDHYLHSKINELKLNLEQYATLNLSDELRNYYTTHFSGLTISDAEKNPEDSVTKALEFVLERYNLMGVLDEFETFITKLKNQAQFKEEYENQRVNVTKDRPSINNISPSTIRKLEEVNFLDVAFYKKITEIIC